MAKTGNDKGKIINEYAISSSKGNMTARINTLFDLLDYFGRKNDITGIAYARLYIGANSERIGEYSTALKYAIPALERFEEIKDTFGIINGLITIGNSFTNSANLEQGLTYWKKSLPIAKQYQNDFTYTTILNNTADCFNKMHLPDSALPYIQEAMRPNHVLKDTGLLAAVSGTLGETYLGLKEYEIARPFLKQSTQYAKQSNSQFAIAYSLNTLSQSFFETNQFDSSLGYAREALFYADPVYKSIMMSAYEWIYKSFEKLNRQDSVNKYFRLAMNTKDSLFTIEKNRNIQSLNFHEQIRQKEIESEKNILIQKRRQNLQYALIALGLIIFGILFLLLSHTLIANQKLITFLGAIALLMVFEFINMYLDPFLAGLTHNSPVMMLLVAVAIAAMLVPVHSWLEKRIIHRLVEKNKKIRLAAAKKTIAKMKPNIAED